MKRTLIFLTRLAALAFALAIPASADPGRAPALQAPTPFLTPTPNERGEIIYTVKEGDTAWRIAAIAQITLEELYALNGLQSTDFMVPGMQLLLGTAGPAEPTPVPGLEPSPTGPPASPTPIFGTGEICALLFLDQNGNASLDGGELPLESGQVSVANAFGEVAGEHTTTEDPEGHCFTELEGGDYNVSAAVPEDYNPTTAMNIPIRLEPGDIKFVEFGAQPSAAIGGGPATDGGRTSSLLGIVGVILLVAAGGLGYYASRYNRRTPMSLR